MRVHLFHQVFTILLFTLSLMVQAQQVYRWVDHDGNIQYGDQPPKEAKNLSPITLYPAPSDIQKQQAEALNKQQADIADQYKAKREAEKSEVVNNIPSTASKDETSQKHSTKDK